MSNNIYTKKCLKKYHYVYCILEISTNKKYIGTRSTNKKPADDLGKKYFSSSKNKEFISSQKENPHNYKYEILLICNTREEAILEEIRLHNLYDVAKNPDFYNKAKQTAKYFDTTGKVSVIDKDGNTMQVNVDDPRYLSGELKSVVAGKNNPFYNKKHSAETKEKIANKLKGQLAGHKNPTAKAISVNGKIYKCAKELTDELGIPASTISRKCHSTDILHKDWFFI